MVSDKVIKRVGYAGAAANWLIPMATVVNLFTGDATNISPTMSATLSVYSALFCRWSLAIKPVNYPLFICHATNSLAQIFTLFKYALNTFLH